MAMTSPDNIWTPDVGDEYDITADLATMADTVQDALLRYRGLRVMTNAQRLALAGANLFNGLHVYTTDTDRYWIYRGGSWIDEGPRDTGWIDLPYVAGFTAGTPGQMAYRVRDGVFYLKGGATGTFPSASYTNVVAAGAIPAEYRPPEQFRGGAFAQQGRAAGVEIHSNGGILFAHRNDTNPSWIAALVSYPIG